MRGQVNVEYHGKSDWEAPRPEISDFGRRSLGKEKKGFNSGAATNDLEGVGILIPPKCAPCHATPDGAVA
jgi:hypothetical protein